MHRLRGGVLYACFEGDNVWKQYDITFTSVDADKHILRWGSQIGAGYVFSGDHHIGLTRISDTETRLENYDVFGGALPVMGMGLPYGKLDRNYKRMNEALKLKLESE